jgi:hypothetical protein
MMKRTTPLVVALVLGSASLSGADDKVSYREPGARKDTDVSGAIAQESPAGVVIKLKSGQSQTIPALQVRQIVYDNRKGPLAFRAPDGALNLALAAAPRSRQREQQLAKALVGFQELDSELKDSERIHAYLQYRIAQVAAIKAQDDATQADAAIAALKAFQKDFSSSWEIVPALKTLAGLQESKGDAEGASETYKALAGLAGAPEELKRQGQMMLVKMLLHGRKFAEAEKRLAELERTSSENDPQRVFVQVYLAQSRIAQGNTGGTKEMLTKAIESSSDSDLRALAHNALGDFYRQQKQNDAAFWEYLKVDTLYSQDREEEARALYNLAELHDKVHNDPIRAEECRTRLASADFAGTFYQRQLKEKSQSGSS